MGVLLQLAFGRSERRITDFQQVERERDMTDYKYSRARQDRQSRKKTEAEGAEEGEVDWEEGNELN